MGVRTVEIRFCDCCDKEIIGRLVTHTCPACHADICVECQTREDNKHKPRERKPKAEQVPGPTPEAPQSTRKRKQVKVEELVEVADKKGDNLTIHVPAPDKIEPYVVSILDSKATSETLRETVVAALARFNGKIPDSLSEENK